MRIICPISGEEFTLPGFSKLQLAEPHPLFKLPIEKLLENRFVNSWGRGEFDEAEAKLYFLALLNSTRSVSWHTIADPSLSVVTQNMERLIKLVGWMGALAENQVAFPQFRVTESNYQLTNISHFITQWYEVKSAYLAGGRERIDLQDRLESIENRLAKQIKDGISTEEMSGRLASWSLDALSVKSPEKRKLWTEYFRLKEPAIYSVDQQSFLEMKTYMEVNLLLPGTHASGAGTVFQQEVLRHLRNQWQLIEDGPLASLTGGETYSFVDTDGSTKVRATVEEVNKRIITANAPTKEPVKSEYPTLVAYLRARAEWQVAVSYREILAEREASVQSDPIASKGL